jgi:hypothetical protein
MARLVPVLAPLREAGHNRGLCVREVPAYRLVAEHGVHGQDQPLGGRAAARQAIHAVRQGAAPGAEFGVQDGHVELRKQAADLVDPETRFPAASHRPHQAGGSQVQHRDIEKLAQRLLPNPGVGGDPARAVLVVARDRQSRF